ncbi:MAG: malic enzyme-like NAD(P)-binding protein, partial [Clostridiaceae bacterium]
VSAPGILKPEMVKLMNKDSIIFAMANPTPEIMPDEAKAAGARVIGTGRSDFPNQVNNVLVFPGLFRGALDVRAKEINLEMKLAAAYAIADYIDEKDLNEENVIPSALDKGVAAVVAEAIRIAAKKTGAARV